MPRGIMKAERSERGQSNMGTTFSEVETGDVFFIGNFAFVKILPVRFRNPELICECGGKTWNASNFDKMVHVCPDTQVMITTTEVEVM